ncbi:MAG: class I SAM-dependent RNA methyltransferase [Bacillota bacterium]
MTLELIATASFGLEAIVAQELKELGFENLKVENAKVTFNASEFAICRTNLWLRTAYRIRLKIGEFKALTFDELFEETKKLPWHEFLPHNANFPVEGKSIKSTLYSVPDCQAIVKKAIVENMKKKYKKQWFDEDGPLFRIEVSLLNDVASLTIDTSGLGLHKRGYRKKSSEAPLRETLAAGLITISRWNCNSILADPFCGSGTILIEAALIGHSIAPGIKRTFISENWPWIPKCLWKEARTEAYDKIAYNKELNILGSDIDESMVSLARENATVAGIEKSIHFQRLSLADFHSEKKYGKIVCNPPYGERLGDLQEVEILYKQMGKVFKNLDTWSFYILTPHTKFEKLFGKKASKKRKLYNGRIKVDFYQFYGPSPR